MLEPIRSEPQARVRVYLFDDLAIVRAALRSLLGARHDIEVVGDGGDAHTALQAIRELRPDVIVLDLARPGTAEYDFLPAVRRALPHTKTVVLTHHESEHLAQEADEDCAEGYLARDSEPGELAQAILAVQRGDGYISRRNGSGAARGPHPGPRANGVRLTELTPREREVFQLLALGRSNKEVAAELEISLGTAKKHRENLQRKLACGSVAELARLAIRAGVVDA